MNEKTKAEKILMWFIWGWFVLSVIVYVISESVLRDELFKPKYSRSILCLGSVAFIVLSPILAIISKIRKFPQIRARYWLYVLIINILSIGSFFLAWAVANDVIAPTFGYHECNCGLWTKRPCSEVNTLPYIADKPIIYFYPLEEMEVFVQLGRPENLTHTYPKYNEGWQMTAEPDGTLKDANGRTYYALYWEGKNIAQMPSFDGFIVAAGDSVKFLEEKLARLGLTEREAQEFIVYWLPKLESNPYNFIRFWTREEIDQNMPLTITPQPANLIRVMMSFRAASEWEQVPMQILPPIPSRNGFTVVEWGGTEL